MKNKGLMISTLIITAIIFGCFACPKDVSAAEGAGSYIEQSAHMNAEMELYVRRTRRSVKAKWYPPTNSFGKDATIMLTIDRDGQLVDSKIVKSSSDEAFDKALEKAAKEAKYQPLPKIFPYKTAEISLEFGMQRRSVTK
jgi:TonB family protein